MLPNSKVLRQRRTFSFANYVVAVCFATLSLTSLARDCSKLVATGNPEYPPYLFRENSSKQLVGANNEIIQAIAKAIDVDIEILYTGPWSRAQKEVRDGRIDLIAGAFFTIPRAQYMDYVYPPFLTTQSVVWQNVKHPFEIDTREDLVGKKGTTVIHNSFGQEFDTFAKEKLDIKFMPTLEQAFQFMALGRADYLLYERSPARAYANIWGIEDQNRVAGPAISSEGLYLTLSHRSPCNTGELRGKLAKAVRELVETGQAEQALQEGMTIWQQLSGSDEKM